MTIRRMKVVSVSDKYVVGQEYFLGIPCGYTDGSREDFEDVDVKVGQWVYIDDYLYKLVGVVVYDKECGAYGLKYKSNLIITFDSLDEMCDWKGSVVIGNIYENPELLEEENFKED